MVSDAELERARIAWELIHERSIRELAALGELAKRKKELVASMKAAGYSPYKAQAAFDEYLDAHIERSTDAHREMIRLGEEYKKLLDEAKRDKKGA